MLRSGTPFSAVTRFALSAWAETSAVRRAIFVVRSAGVSCFCDSLPIPTTAKPMRRAGGAPPRTPPGRASAAEPAAAPASSDRRVGLFDVTGIKAILGRRVLAIPCFDERPRQQGHGDRGRDACGGGEQCRDANRLAQAPSADGLQGL